MSIKDITKEHAKSRPAIIDCLRNHLARAYKDEITEIKIEIKVNGITESESISTHTLNRI